MAEPAIPEQHTRYVRPAASLVDTLILLMKAEPGERHVTRLGGGLCLSYAPGSTFTCSRRGIRPSPKEIQTLCAHARKVGLHLTPELGQPDISPDEGGDYQLVRWTLTTIQL